MRNARILLGLGALLFVIVTGWQIASAEIANYELHEILRDVASRQAARIGLTPPRTDQFLRSDVISKAREDGIQIGAEEVTVRRSGTEQEPIVFIAADYAAPVKVLPGLAFSLHFVTTSAK